MDDAWILADGSGDYGQAIDRYVAGACSSGRRPDGAQDSFIAVGQQVDGEMLSATQWLRPTPFKINVVARPNGLTADWGKEGRSGFGRWLRAWCR